MNDFVPWIPWIGCLLAFLCLLGSLRAGSRKRLIDDIPTSKTTGVFIGLVELKGTAEAERPLVSYLAEERCVHYAWSIDERWSRIVTETYTDSEGKTQTRTRHESGWTTVDSGGETLDSFYLKDDSGAIRVRSEGAKLECVSVFDESCSPPSALYYGKGPSRSVRDSDHVRRFHEQAIPLHHDLYLMGHCREREDVVAPEIAADKKAPLFLISTRTEEQIRSGFGWGYWSWGIFGLLLCLGSFIGRDLAANQDTARRWPLYLIPAAGFFAACSKHLIAIQERYPEIKAQASFLNLQRNLIDTEQRIALARAYFNDNASFYNARLQVVPDRFVAALGRLQPQPIMAANDFERAPVPVKLID